MRKCKDWIDTYLEYTQSQESPTAFHEWVALSIMAAAVGRNVWIPRIKYIIYPNLYVILVAASAKCRKSSALAIGRGILEKIKEPPMIFAQKITVEALIQALREDVNKEDCCNGLILSSELSVFMGADAMKSGVIPALTDLYDSPRHWTYHTRGRGKEELENVTLSMLAATTKDGIKDCLPKGSVGGGFTSRIIFVYQEAPSTPKLFNVEDDEGHELIETIEERQLKANLIEDLEEIRHKVKGPVKFSKEAKEKALVWYKEEQTKIRDEKLDGYYGRKHDVMFKLATLLSMSASNTLNITPTHIDRALYMLEDNEVNMAQIIASVVASQSGTDTEKILNLIKRAGVIKHSDLMHKCWRIGTAIDVNNMLATLNESGDIKVEMTENNTRQYKVNPRRHAI